MQGQWKDTKCNFVKDKRRAFHRATLCSEGAKEKAIKGNNHTYELYEGYGRRTYYLEKFYGYTIGRDISWRLICNDLIHTKKHSRRKVAQMIVNGMDRTIIRDYIKKGDFDMEIPTHNYSKTIKWMVD